MVVTSLLLTSGLVLSANALPWGSEQTTAFAATDPSEMSVAQIEVELARVRANASQSDINARMAEEQLAQSRDRLDQANARVKEAQDAVNASKADLDKARDNLAEVSQTAYRAGNGGLDQFAPYLKTDGLAELERSDKAISTFSAEVDQRMQQVLALEKVTNTLSGQAQEAQQQAQKANDQVQEKTTQARGEAKQARDEVTQVERRRETLINALAQRRKTSVEEETRRQNERDEQQARRVEADERIRVERQQNRPQPSAPEATQTPQPSPSRPAPSQPAPAPSRPEPTRPAPTQRPAPRPTPPKPKPQPAPAPAPAPSLSGAQQAIAFARSKIGATYVWGGEGPGYDCSGIVMMAWRSAGRASLPHSSQQQYYATARVPISQLQPGDLIFYGRGGSANAIYHVAMYTGNGRMIEAVDFGYPLTEGPLRYTGLVPSGGRVL